MIKKIPIVMLLLILIMHSTLINAEVFNHAEIFDPKQNKVVKVIQLNTEIHNIVASYIKDIDGMYGKNNPVTDDGYAIKIPLNPAVRVQGKWLDTLVDEVYIIIPENEPPFLMVFEDKSKNKLSCFPFKGNIDTLSKILDFNLKIR